MRTNMGISDRLIRSFIAIAILVLYFLDVISGTLAVIGLTFAVIFIGTSMISFCPLYKLFNISTK